MTVKLEGALNFRDLGGYQTGDGRRVSDGRVLRPDSPSSLTGSDVALIGQLGIRPVCDLRSSAKCRAAPNRWLA